MWYIHCVGVSRGGYQGIATILTEIARAELVPEGTEKGYARVA